MCQWLRKTHKCFERFSDFWSNLCPCSKFIRWRKRVWCCCLMLFTNIYGWIDTSACWCYWCQVNWKQAVVAVINVTVVVTVCIHENTVASLWFCEIHLCKSEQKLIRWKIVCWLIWVSVLHGSAFIVIVYYLFIIFLYINVCMYFGPVCIITTEWKKWISPCVPSYCLCVCVCDDGCILFPRVRHILHICGQLQAADLWTGALFHSYYNWGSACVHSPASLKTVDCNVSCGW